MRAGRFDHSISRVLQQGNNGIRSRIGDQAPHPIRANLDAGSIGLNKDGVTDHHIRQPDPRVPFDHKDPGFLIGIERPVRIRGEVDPLNDEMRTRDKRRSSRGEAS